MHSVAQEQCTRNHRCLWEEAWIQRQKESYFFLQTILVYHLSITTYPLGNPGEVTSPSCVPLFMALQEYVLEDGEPND